MNIVSLTNILAAQQLGDASQIASEASSIANGATNFQSYLSSENEDIVPAYLQAAILGNNSTTPQAGEGVSPTNELLSQEGLLNSASSITSKLGNLNGNGQAANSNNGANSLNQSSGLESNLEEQKSDLIDVLNKAKAITDVAGEENSEDVIPTLLKLQESDLEASLKGQEATANNIAAKVVNIAKGQAQTPDISQTHVKSDQAESLLGKSSEAQLNSTNIQNQNAQDANNIALGQKASIAASQGNNKNIDSRKFLDDLAQEKSSLFGSSKNAGNANGINANGALSEGSQSQLESNLSGQNRDTLANQSMQNNASSPNNGEYVKFQNHLSYDSNNLNANNATNENGSFSSNIKADDIVAQIKFGVSNLAGKNSNNVTIQLHPKELGTVDIRMEIASTGKVNIAVMAENSDTLNLLQKESGMLREMLQDALQTNSTEMNFSFHDGQSDQWKRMINESFANSFGNNLDEEIEENQNLNNISQYQKQITAMDGLDIKV